MLPTVRVSLAGSGAGGYIPTVAPPVIRKIDVRAIMQRKNPALAERLPGFAHRLIARLVHQDELNEGMERLAGTHGLVFVRRVLEFLDVEVEVRGASRIPLRGRITVCANHPLGGLDGLGLLDCIGSLRGEVKAPANDMLMELGPLHELLVPVDKSGPNTAHIPRYLSLFAGEDPVLVFPAGRTSRPRRGRLREYPWSRSFVLQSRRNARTIVPIHVGGRNSALFYLCWRLRRLLGIRPILEQVLLPRELLKKKGSRLVLTVGRPVAPERLADGRSAARWAAELERYVARLGLEGVQACSP